MNMTPPNKLAPSLAFTLGACAAWTLLVLGALRLWHAQAKVDDWLLYFSWGFPLPLLLGFFHRCCKEKVRALVPWIAIAAIVSTSDWATLALGGLLTAAQWKIDDKIPRRHLIWLFVCWCAAEKLCYWLPHRFASFIARHPQAVLVIIASIFVARRAPRSARPKWYAYALLLFCALPLAFHAADMTPSGRPAHWSFYVGPAELLRQGGWLLHDVPSQYGFLPVMLLRALPFSAFTNLLLLQGSLSHVATAILFSLLSRVMAIEASFLAAIVAINGVPGWLSGLYGPANYPSCGAYRFFPPLALIALALEERYLLLGDLIWITSLFWSIETAAYSSVAWLPFRVWRKQKLARLVLLPSLLGLALTVFYGRHGIVPEPRAFVEYALRYTGGFGAIWMSHRGAAVLLFLLGAFQLHGLLQAMRERASSLPLALGASLVFFAVSSYYFSRSHDNNILNVFPILVASATVIAVILRLPHVTLFATPALAIALALNLGHPDFSRTYFAAVRALGTPSKLATYPMPPSPALNLARKAGLGPADRLLYFGPALFLWPDERGPRMQRFFLPAAPGTQLFILSRERQRTYVERWLKENAIDSGALLFPDAAPPPGPLFEFLDERFKAAPPLHSEGWTLLRYPSARSPRGSSPFG